MIIHNKRKGKKPIVLVVEDNKKQAELLVKMINETALYQAISAHHGYEALATLKQHRRGFDFLTNRVACVVLDWQMPEMNGEQFLSRLRKQETIIPFKQFIPVVILSAYGDEERRRLAENPSLGMVSAYFTKPCDESAFLNALYRIVYQKEAEILREMLIEKRMMAPHGTKPRMVF